MLVAKQMAIAKFFPSGKVKVAMPTFEDRAGVPSWAMYVAACCAMFRRDDLRRRVINLYMDHADELNAAGNA